MKPRTPSLPPRGGGPGWGDSGTTPPDTPTPVLRTDTPRKGEGERPAAWLITDGKIGDEIPMRGLAAAMGLATAPRRIRPRKFFAALAPWGPADPLDVHRLCHARENGHPEVAGQMDSRFRGNDNFPTVAFAAGRRTVPVLRALKAASPATFTIFLGNPHTRRHGADVIWAPAHDELVRPAVMSTLTTPHPYSSATLAAFREKPDPRIAVLPSPRAGLLIGGASRHHAFGPAETEALVAAAHAIRAQGFSLAATISRRTPPALTAALRETFRNDPDVFLWTGQDDNPYGSLLACANTLLVTADSTNMVSEAVATSAPVHLFEPSGGHPRLTRLIDGLIAAGRVRRWAGVADHWPVKPIDATPQVAAELKRRLDAFQQARGVDWRDGRERLHWRR